MKIAADFGITVTDLLRKDKDGNLFHNTQLSSGEVSPEYLKQLFKDLDLNKEVELIAVTGGRHLSIGEEVEGVEGEEVESEEVEEADKEETVSAEEEKEESKDLDKEVEEK